MNPREGTLGLLLETVTHEDGGAVVLFTEGGCRVGEAVEPKLEALLHARYPSLRFVVVSKNHAPEFAAQLGIFVFPTVVVWFAGKETARFVRTFSLEAVDAAIARPYELLLS